MKTMSILIVGLSLLMSGSTAYCNEKPGNQDKDHSSNSSLTVLNVQSTPELSGIASLWANEFSRMNPGMKIQFGAISKNETGSCICIVSGPVPQTDQSKWRMVVGHEALVPFINQKNPLLSQLMQQGISSEKTAQIFTGEANLNWGIVTGGGQRIPLHVYLTDDPSTRTQLANFTHIKASAIKGIRVSSQAEMISAIQQDPYAVGFSNLPAALQNGSFQLRGNICMLPIDKNMNGRIDKFENIYENPQAFLRGIWVGKYPASLSNTIYAVSASKPAEKNAIAFLNWVMADGQQYLKSSGYAELAGIEIQTNLAALGNEDVTLAQSTQNAGSRLWILLISCFVIAGILATAFAKYVKKLRSMPLSKQISITPMLNENSIDSPKGLYYDKSHTWAFMEKDGNVKIGIDDFLQHVTGNLTRIKMKETGEKVRKGEAVMNIIHDGKQLTLYSPVSGTILERNQSVISDSSLLNSSPYSEGWVYLIEPINWAREIQFLFMAEKYKEWLRGEFIRLKDFFAASVMANTSVYAQVILQDGGEITDNILADLGPEIWEDFQEGFINTSR